MKITLESPLRMTLKNDNLMSYLGGLVFIGIALWFAYSWKWFYLFSPDVQFNTNNLVPMAFCVVFVLIGLWVIATTKRISIVLDKSQQTGLISFQSSLGEESKRFELTSVKNIRLRTNVDIETYSRSHGGTGTRRYYHYLLVFTLANGDTPSVELGKASAGILTNRNSTYEKNLAKARQIAEFLGAPLVGIDNAAAQSFGEIEGTTENEMEEQQKEWKNKV